MSAGAEVRPEEMALKAGGSEFRLVTPVGRIDISTGLTGGFNVMNCLAAAAGALQAGIGLDAIATGLSRMRSVPGRFERIDLGQPFAVVVDYAHTPTSLETILRASRSLAAPEGRLICVFGCGGDCDRSKRPVMGALAGRLADLVVVTSDNPRFESPELIIAGVLEGLIEERFADEDAVVPDRPEAIAHALGVARPGDVVLIAGKGAEQSQNVRGQKIPLDDREVAREALRTLGWMGLA
jgi:UDP-N-acetylmuramoyl-L-alanyl-D-glutamate--2,6-diaminopimelate ligase